MISVHEGLAAWLLDHHLLLAEFPQRYLRIYNPAAAGLWLLLAEDALDRPGLVRAYGEVFNLSAEQAEWDVTQCLAEWRGQGWLTVDASGLWRIAPRYEADFEAMPSANQLPDHTILHRGIYRFGDAAFGLEVGETRPMGLSGLAARLVAMARGFPVVGTEATASLRVVVAEDATYIQVGDTSPSVWFDPIEAVGQVILAIFHLAHPRASILATLHAAAVGRERTVVLAGVSGAGKSTLAAYLVGRGWCYQGDDIIGVAAHVGSHSGGRVLPLPTAVSLKEGSWGVLGGRYPGLEALENIEYGAKIARYLPLSEAVEAPAGTRDVAAWVFPSYRSGAATRIQPLSAVAALEALITSGMALDARLDRYGLENFLAILSGVPRYRLEYSDLTEAETWLNELASV
ncbi:putative PqqD family peptide modification chaperone [Gammaproteobacteria bacterium]